MEIKSNIGREQYTFVKHILEIKIINADLLQIKNSPNGC